MPSGKFFFIQSRMNDLVLDIKDGVLEPGSDVVTWAKNGSDNQLWYQDKACGCIRSKADDDLVLHDAGEKMIVEHHHPGEECQSWCLSLEHVQNKSSGKVLDIAEENTEEGARICAWKEHGGINQKWRIDYQPMKRCYIRSEMHDKVLDVAKASQDAGADVVLWDCKEDSSDNQLWWEDEEGRIHSCLNDYILDTSGKYLVLNPPSEEASQQWNKSARRIMNAHQPDMVLDIDHADKDNGGKVLVWEYKGASNQHWRFQYID